MKRRITLSLALWVAFRFQPGFAASTNDSRLEPLLQKARSLEARSRTDLAAQVWHEVLIVSPEQTEALSALVRWAQQNGKTAEANAYLKKLRKLNPDLLVPTSAGEADLAPRRSALLTKAGQLAAAQRYEEAMEIYKQIFGSHPPDGGWALAYYQTEAHVPAHADDAIQALRTLAQRYPEVAEYRVALGSILTDRPETRHAGIAELESVDDGSPMSRRARQVWRQALVWEKQNPAFQVDLTRYLARYPDAELAIAAQAIRASSPSGTGVPAMDSLERAGYEALKKDNLQEAEANFHSVLLNQPDNSRALAGLGFVHMKAGAFAEAAAEFEAAIKSDPTNEHWQDALRSSRFWATMRRASDFAKQGNLPAAIRDYQTALSMRGNDPDALRGLAGGYLRSGQSKQAVNTAAALVQVQPDQADNWEVLLRALEQSNPKAARERLLTVPEPILQQLAQRAEFQILAASIAVASGFPDDARRHLQELRGAETLSDDSKVTLAHLQILLGDPGSAVLSMREVISRDADRSDAWDVLVSALVASGRSEEAQRSITSMPGGVQKFLTRQPGFLQTLASMDEALGNTEKAIDELSAVIGLRGSHEPDPTLNDVDIQLAALLSKAGFTNRAEDILQNVLRTRPDSEAAWSAYVALLQKQNEYTRIVSVFGRMPSSVVSRLTRDSGMVATWAEAEANNGNSERAIVLLRNHLQDTERRGSTAPAALQIQLGWLLLNTAEPERELYPLLESGGSRPDLTPAERTEFSNIWITSILRTADSARRRGQVVRAEHVLEQGMEIFPNETRLKAAYAGNLLQGGEARRAFDAYLNWGLQDATAPDYAGAIGAALSGHHFQYADVWIANGLRHWPDDPSLLQLAGDRAKARGNFNAAVRYWKEALKAKRSEKAIANARSTGESSGYAALVTAEGVSPSVQQDKHADNGLITGRTVLAAFTRAAGSASLQASLAAPHVLDPGVVQTSVLPKPSSTANELSWENDLSNRIAGVESRNTPLLSSGVALRSRNGQAGFDRLLIEQADLEASAVLANDVRVTVAARPTYLNSGSSSGPTALSFGTLAAGATFSPQHAIGVAADAQISTASYGVRLGSSPDGFLTRDFVGGFRLNPRNGPITFLLERDSVRDTLLSYSGARDPVTHQIWGGVVSNTASLQGHWGTNRSGFYTSTGYQFLSGRNVAANRAIMGNIGNYAKVASRGHGSLTLGTNFSAMHYDKNLRYFTLGQGGYFSPQQYFLFGVPFHWSGTYGRRLQYSAGGSLGVQRFQEDSSPFYPNSPRLQAQSGESYAALRSVGANFSLDGQALYQLAPQWIAGTFFSANNARNYASIAGGFFVKFTFDPKPLGFDHAVPGVPNWRGQQPLSEY